MSLEEFLKDIFRMPDPDWFSNRWGQIVKEWNEKAEKWDKIYWMLDDDEMPVTPERIAMVLNFVNDHWPDFDTPEEFEKTINELLEWEGELIEAESKLEAVRKWQDSLSYSMSPEKWVMTQGELNEILEDHSCSETADKVEK